MRSGMSKKRSPPVAYNPIESPRKMTEEENRGGTVEEKD